MTIRTDDMETAGEMVQDLCSFLQVQGGVGEGRKWGWKMKILMGGLEDEDGCDSCCLELFQPLGGICVLIKSFCVLYMVDTHRLVEFSLAETPEFDGIGASFRALGGFMGFLNDHT